MSALIVYESHFGSNAIIARAIAAELDGDAVSIVDAPEVIGADVGLVVAGGPTHALALSSAATRAAARAAGGAPEMSGLRDWLRTAQLREDQRIALFTTHSSPLSGSAARAGRRLLTRRRLDVVAIGEFIVTGQAGPLAAGELQRASAWARELQN